MCSTIGMLSFTLLNMCVFGGCLIRMIVLFGVPIAPTSQRNWCLPIGFLNEVSVFMHINSCSMLHVTRPPSSLPSLDSCLIPSTQDHSMWLMTHTRCSISIACFHNTSTNGPFHGIMHLKLYVTLTPLSTHPISRFTFQWRSDLWMKMIYGLVLATRPKCAISVLSCIGKRRILVSTHTQPLTCFINLGRMAIQCPIRNIGRRMRTLCDPMAVDLIGQRYIHTCKDQKEMRDNLWYCLYRHTDKAHVNWKHHTQSCALFFKSVRKLIRMACSWTNTLNDTLC